ncbi:hypothetical protein [Enterobacter sp. R1(2018)]|uniref:hypothetical protein n=1 Tax=Enterobacter sp. R1(2018) TaxID=2447891 RepID=UPI0011C35AFF|nr:hypothetical protein [Enterobacter sp. R1(2018)]
MNNTAEVQMKPLSETDKDILANLPDDEWFEVMHLPINRPQYRCERLEERGKLESRVTGEYPHIIREYRKMPYVPEPCPRCGCRSSRPNGEHYCHQSRKQGASHE